MLSSVKLKLYFLPHRVVMRYKRDCTLGILHLFKHFGVSKLSVVNPSSLYHLLSWCVTCPTAFILLYPTSWSIALTQSSLWTPRVTPYFHWMVPHRYSTDVLNAKVNSFPLENLALPFLIRFGEGYHICK